MAELFASVSEDELCRLIEKKNSNSKRATKASVRVFNEYLQEKNLDEPHRDGGSIIAGRTFRKAPYFVPSKPQTAFVFF